MTTPNRCTSPGTLVPEYWEWIPDDAVVGFPLPALWWIEILYIAAKERHTVIVTFSGVDTNIIHSTKTWCSTFAFTWRLEGHHRNPCQQIPRNSKQSKQHQPPSCRTCSSSCALNMLHSLSLSLKIQDRVFIGFHSKRKKNEKRKTETDPVSLCSLLRIKSQAVFPLYREVNYGNINIISFTAAPAGVRRVQVFLSPPFSVFCLSSLYWPAVLRLCCTHTGDIWSFVSDVIAVGLKCVVPPMALENKTLTYMCTLTSLWT